MKKSLLMMTLVLSASAVMAGGPDSERPDWKNKSMTRAESLELAGKHFDQMDTNNDGVVSPEERRAAFEKHMKDRAGHERGPHGKKPGKDGPPPDAPK
jgi:hypothetical protein